MKVKKKLYIYILFLFFINSCSNNQKLIITRGLPGSGKSTFALNYAKNNKNTIIIEKDILRKELYKEKWIELLLLRESETLVLHIQFERIIKNLREGKNVIVANTHLDDRYMPIFNEISKSFNAELIIKDFRNTPLEVCLERDAKREIQSVISIKDLHSKYIATMKNN